MEDADLSNVSRSPSVSSLSSSPIMSGVAVFVSQDSGTAGQRVGVPGALIVGDCMIGGSKYGYRSVATGADGSFSVTCPAGITSFKGQLKLEANTHRIYEDLTAFPANTNFNIAANATDSIFTNYNESGRVFRYHHEWHALATTTFSRTRSQMRYVVNPYYISTSYYGTSDDLIYLYQNSFWDSWGSFVISHEYGHAFHYTAIDPWIPSSYDCSPNGPGHSFNGVETSSCAYVEGFANFFAATMLLPQPDQYSAFRPLSLELNAYATSGLQNLFVEYNFAAVLWDFWDGLSTPDGLAGDDDEVSMTGAQLADIIGRCRLWSPNTYRLTHTDQFIYCAEGAVNNARYQAPIAFQNGWGLYGSQLTWDVGGPTLPQLSSFRAIWKFNFYGI